MANILSTEKQIAVVHALAEGSSIRSIERMTGVNRNTIMSLGLRVGKACADKMDVTMRNLDLDNIQVDEIWGFIGKKQRNVTGSDCSTFGDVWTWIAMDRDTKLVPSYIVGKRDHYHAHAFMYDLSSRIVNRPQISSDGLNLYEQAIERGFGIEADYGQVIKVYGAMEFVPRKYSPPPVIGLEKKVVRGKPIFDQISTSHIEKQNHTLRMHCRRLTRLTNAFSKKLPNFKAAIALNLYYYNFVKIHTSLRCTPAMAAGVSSSIGTVRGIIEMTA
jgi:IS1 family transposase